MTTLGSLKIGDKFRFPESEREVHTILNRTEHTMVWTTRKGDRLSWNNGINWEAEVEVLTPADCLQCGITTVTTELNDEGLCPACVYFNETASGYEGF